MLENVDTHTYGDKRVDHITRYRVNLIFDTYLITENVMVQKRSRIIKEIKISYEFIGYSKINQRLKKKMKENVIQNINSAINSIKRSRQKNFLVVRREMHMAMVSSSTKENRLVKSMAQALGTSQKNLHKLQNFRFQIDVNDELSCWRVICRQRYKDRLGKHVKKIIFEY